MTIDPRIQRFLAAGSVAAAALLSGCASLHTVSSSVATYGSWPAEMTPGTYAFDRLPSQEKDPKRQESLESAAALALASAGFKPAAEGAKPAVTVQVGARIERFETSPWDDPFWGPGWRHGFGYPGWYGPYGGGYGFRRGPFWGPFPPQQDVYEREVALLIRDAASGKPLYETRATNSGGTEGGDRLLAAMFDASLRDFPQAVEKPHEVNVDLTTMPAATPPVAAPAKPGTAS